MIYAAHMVPNILHCLQVGIVLIQFRKFYTCDILVDLKLAEFNLVEANWSVFEVGKKLTL